MNNRYRNKSCNFNLRPVVEVKGAQWSLTTGWEAVCAKLTRAIAEVPGEKKLVVVETYQGVIHE